MTQLELARAVGISRASLANIERGEQRVYIHHLVAIAAALDLDVTDLLPSPGEFKPVTPAKISVSGDKINRAQERAIKELVSSITSSIRNKL